MVSLVGLIITSTNAVELANERAMNFSLFSMILLVVLGVYQIWNLKKFFEQKVRLKKSFIQILIIVQKII